MRKKIGIYSLGMVNRGGSGSNCVLMAQALQRRYDVTLIFDREHPQRELESYFGVDLSGVRQHILDMPVQRAAASFLNSRLGSKLRFGHLDALINDLRRDLDPTYYEQMRPLNLDLFINNTFASNLRCPAPLGLYVCMFPHPMKGQPKPYYGLVHSLYQTAVDQISSLTPQVLDSYTVIGAVSEYTAHWVGKRWNKPATVIYPAPNSMGPPAAKENWILHVGRFAPELRADYKHQGTMMRAFRGMTALHQRKWSLHFAGSVVPEAASVRMLAAWKEEVRDLPIHFHTSIDFNALRELYRRSAVYWHATGFGSQAEDRPFWQEHFGMTTVEAMSAGAVPVVIDSGGHKETVQHGTNGYRWSTLAEMENFTVRLAEDAELRGQLSAAAVTASSRFSAQAFADRIESLVGELFELPAQPQGHR